MSKAVELLAATYVRLKERGALQHVLHGWQKTYRDLEQQNSPKNILDRLAREIEIIQAALDSLGNSNEATQAASSAGANVLSVKVSVAAADTAGPPPSPPASGNGNVTTVRVTGLSVEVST